MLLGKCLLFLACAWLLRSCSTYGRDDFDRGRWHAAGFNAGERCGMADDVMSRVVLAGMTEAQVRGRLGAPERVNGNSHEYMLGMCSFVDPSSLSVRYSPGGQVLSVRIVEH